MTEYFGLIPINHFFITKVGEQLYGYYSHTFNQPSKDVEENAKSLNDMLVYLEPIALAYKAAVLEVAEVKISDAKIKIEPDNRVITDNLKNAVLDNAFVRQEIGDDVKTIDKQPLGEQLAGWIGVLFPNDPTNFPKLLQKMARDYEKEVFVRSEAFEGILIGNKGDIIDVAVRILKARDLIPHVFRNEKDLEITAESQIMRGFHPVTLGTLGWVKQRGIYSRLPAKPERFDCN